MAEDWLLNDLPEAVQILLPESLGEDAISLLGGSKDLPTSQFVTSAQTLNNAMADYPNAMFDIYGHSLGAMDGQYAAASAVDPSRIRNAYLYEGPNSTLAMDALATQKVRMGQIAGLIAYYKQHGNGSLTGSQKIAINKLGMEAMSAAFADITDTYLGSDGTLATTLNTGIADATTTWTNAQTAMDSSAPVLPDAPLSDSEKLSIFENSNAGKSDVQTRPVDRYTDDLDVVKSVHEDFSRVADSLHQAKKEIAEADEMAAALMETW